MLDLISVIIIDSNEIDNYITKKNLELIGITNVIIFNNPISAVNYLNNTPCFPKIIFLELFFKNIDGFEALNLLEKCENINLSYTKIIMFSATLEEFTKERLKENAPYITYIEKPLGKEKLHHYLDEILLNTKA